MCGASACRTGGSISTSRSRTRPAYPRALSVILQKTISGLPASEIADVDASIVERLFRQNISMGKGLGLMSMVQAVQSIAKAAAAQDTHA